MSWLATCLSLMTTCLAALILTSRLQFLELEVVGFIILIIAISSLVFSFGILQNFSAALLTIICCHCVDMEENDGSEFQPYAMPLSLRKLLHLD